MECWGTVRRKNCATVSLADTSSVIHVPSAKLILSKHGSVVGCRWFICIQGLVPARWQQISHQASSILSSRTDLWQVLRQWRSSLHSITQFSWRSHQPNEVANLMWLRAAITIVELFLMDCSCLMFATHAMQWLGQKDTSNRMFKSFQCIWSKANVKICKDVWFQIWLQTKYERVSTRIWLSTLEHLLFNMIGPEDWNFCDAFLTSAIDLHSKWGILPDVEKSCLC